MFNAVAARTIRRVGLLMGFACRLGLVFAEPTKDVRSSTCPRLIESLRQDCLKAKREGVQCVLNRSKSHLEKFEVYAEIRRRLGVVFM